MPDPRDPRSAARGPGAVLHQCDRYVDHGPGPGGAADYPRPGLDPGAVRSAGLQQDRGQGAQFAIARADRRAAVRRCTGDADRAWPAAQAPRRLGRLHGGRLERDGPRELLRRSAGPGLHGAVRADVGSEMDRRPDRALHIQQEPEPVGRDQQPVRHLPDQMGPGTRSPLPAAGLHVLLGDLPVWDERSHGVCEGGLHVLMG